MKNNINNKGFTLVELLAVLVILAAIMGIAIPSITSSIERSKEKQNNQKKKMLESFAELYVIDHKNAIYKNIPEDGSCYIRVTTLESKGYLPEGANETDDGDPINGTILFNRKTNTYDYHSEDVSDDLVCVE